MYPRIAERAAGPAARPLSSPSEWHALLVDCDDSDPIPYQQPISSSAIDDLARTGTESVRYHCSSKDDAITVADRGTTLAEGRACSAIIYL